MYIKYYLSSFRLTCPFAVLDTQWSPVGHHQWQQVCRTSLCDLEEHVAYQQQRGQEPDDSEPEYDGSDQRVLRVEHLWEYGRRFDDLLDGV